HNGGPQPNRCRQQGSPRDRRQHGMTETNGVPAPENPGQVATLERFMRRTPERLLLTALDNPAGADTLDLYFDRRTGLLVLTETLTDDPILGDRVTRTAFTRWQDAGGVLLWRQLDVEVNNRLQNHSVATAISTNPAGVLPAGERGARD